MGEVLNVWGGTEAWAFKSADISSGYLYQPGSFSAYLLGGAKGSWRGPWSSGSSGAG